MSITPRWILIVVWGAGCVASGASPSLNLLPNPRFESGATAVPDGWALGSGAGEWIRSTNPAGGVLRVRGGGGDSAAWHSGNLAVAKAGLYGMRFQGRRVAGATEGTAFAGVGLVHRDFGFTADWRTNAFVWQVPESETAPAARLGQWHVRGGVEFRDVAVVPVEAVYERLAQGVELGEGESVRGGVYRFEPDLNWVGANASRNVVTNRVGFNSNRWLFEPGGELVFRHAIPGDAFTRGRVRVGINHHTAGALVVEARSVSGAWTPAGRFDGAHRAGEVELPAGVFPASSFEVRLRHEGAIGAAGGFQVDTYGVEAGLREGRSEGEGATRFVIHGISGERAGIPFAGSPDESTSFLEAGDYGYGLPAGADLEVWWCEAGWKVGRRRAGPRVDAAAAGSTAVVRVQLARGEFEAAQVVLRPRPGRGAGGVTLREVAVEGWCDRAGSPAAIGVEVAEVGYVHVTRPTDGTCARGWYPDPLPPLRLPLELEAERNQPLWLTFHAPRELPAGEYRSTLRLRTTTGEVRVPLAVEVFRFELPRETHLHSALGLGMGEINRYHRLTQRADQVTVFEKYLANFAAHRISPYSFFDHAPLRVSFEGEGEHKTARVDFTAFDAAATRWLDEARFSTFQLPLQGMGGGTFQARHLGRLEGFQEGTPEHARLFRDYLGQVERHLRERGWLAQAFTYWFDEPDPKDYDFVVEGMKRLKEAAPGIRRMLTEQPEPALLGHVDIWCGLTPEWTRERVRERRTAGEEVWWYICTGPKAPYVTEFIDHPGTELRLWPWQSWQYGVKGILVWATIYWNSPLVYTGGALQDPWEDPMSWVSGYDFPVGHRSPWGNGDGRFLYPPRRDPNGATEPCLDGPIPSVRWESLRDGMEDYEYLWLLQEEVERRARAGGTGADLDSARALLEVPTEVSADLVHFTADPRVILARRERIARAIERLQGAR